jgi:hypothetical protein
MKYPIPAAVALASLAAFSAQAAERTGEEGFAGAAIVSEEALSAERAKGDDNSINCVICTANGTSNIAGNAFQNAVGVFTIIQNTGNQVFLDTVTVVNVSISK